MPQQRARHPWILSPHDLRRVQDEHDSDTRAALLTDTERRVLIKFIFFCAGFDI